MKTYLCVYLGSTLLALVVTPAVIWLARRIKAVDAPSVRKVHLNPVPRIGGVAIFISVICLILPALFLQNVIGDKFQDIQLKIITLLATATFVFLVGLVDDIRGLRARMKLIAELFAATIVCAVGIRIQSVTVADWLTLNFGLFSWPLTLLWIVGITNAVNLSDGLDGLAAGISAIACGVIAILAIHGGQAVMAVLMLAMLGSLSGFLVFNFSPAKIFMGDCGSLFLGFTIATASVMCASKSSALVGLVLPMLALGIPIFDTLFSMLRRFLERRSVFSADRRHFHHRLLALGLTQRHVVLVIYALTALAAGLGMFMMLTRNVQSLVVLFCVLILLLLVFRVVGSVRLRETVAGLQKKYALSQHRREERIGFEDAQLHFRDARTFDQWWQAVCEAAQQMDLAWVSLKTKDKDGTVRTEVWRLADAPPDMSDLVIMNIPVRDHPTAGPMEFEIAVLVNGSLESASHRATLFSRLLDEHGAMVGGQV